MKKASSILILTLCSVSLLGIPACINSAFAQANVLYVGVGQKYSTIQSALDNSAPNQTIFVYNGTYYEHVYINQSISLIGQSRETTIIDGELNGTAVTLNANGASIRGFTIRNSGIYHGVLVSNANGNFIGDNRITNNSDGISLEHSSNNIIHDNIIDTNTNYGILNTQFSSNNLVTGNSLEFNYYGMFVTHSNDNIIYHNNFNNNTIQLFASGELVNVWDLGGEGNYWSDYHGFDHDEDGIGDTPYSFSGITDNYPLMGRFYNFDVAFQEQNFNLTIISNSSVSDFKFELGPETGNRIIQYYAQNVDSNRGFSRVRISRALMDDPYTVIAGVEVNFTLLSSSNSSYADVYFTYGHAGQTVTILTSETMRLYTNLLKTQSDLEKNLETLNSTYQTLLQNYNDLLGNYTRLQQSYASLSDSSQSALENSSQSGQNIRSLSYIFASIVAVFIVVTVYLSRRAREQSISANSKAVNTKDNASR